MNLFRSLPLHFKWITLAFIGILVAIVVIFVLLVIGWEAAAGVLALAAVANFLLSFIYVAIQELFFVKQDR